MSHKPHDKQNIGTGIQCEIPNFLANIFMSTYRYNYKVCLQVFKIKSF